MEYWQILLSMMIRSGKVMSNLNLKLYFLKPSVVAIYTIKSKLSIDKLTIKKKII